MSKWSRLLVVLVLLIVPGWAEANAQVVSTKEYLVLFKQDKLPTDYQQVITSAGGLVKSVIPQLGAVVAQSDYRNFLLDLAGNNKVEEAGLNVNITLEEDIFRLLKISSLAPPVQGDLYQMFQWDIQRVGGKPATWAKQAGNHQVVVAVLDTGIDAEHPDLAGNYLYGKSFVPGYPDGGEDGNGHGTHVAGAIAANGRVIGVGPGLGLASYRIFDPTGQGSVDTVAQAIVVAADDGVDVINLSIGGYVNKTDKQSMAEYQLLKKAVNYSLQRQVTLVAAAGNNGVNLQKKNQLIPSLRGGLVAIPVGIPGVLGVSATNKSDELAFYSNYGQSVIDLAGPGGDVGANFDPITMTGEMDILSANLSTVPGGGYGWMLGTSMATPKVSAVAGLIIAQHGKIGPDRVAALMKKSAVDLGKPGKDEYFGFGMVNAEAAISN
jgi:subtilisin family serine protease